MLSIFSDENMLFLGPIQWLLHLHLSDNRLSFWLRIPTKLRVFVFLYLNIINAIFQSIM